MFTYDKTDITSNEIEILMKANSKYIVSIEDGKINILVFENKMLKKVLQKKYNIDFEKLEMSKIYYNIFLTISSGFIDLFEILNSSNIYELENRLRIETNDKINFSKFSGYNEKIIGAVSKKNIIRLWNIDSTFNHITIQTNFKTITDFIFNKNSDLLLIQGYYEDDSYEILIYDISYDIKTKKVIKRKEKEHIYELSEKNFDKIMLINKNYIEFMDLNNDTIYFKIELNTTPIKHTYFYKNINKLIICSSNIPFIIDIKTHEIEKSPKNESWIYDDFFRVDKNKFYINILRDHNIESFCFNINNDESIIYTEKESKNLFTKKFKKIFTKSNLDFKFSEINNEEITEKSYFKIKEIEEALHENYSLSLETKKENVIKGIKNYNNEASPSEQYIFLLKLLIQDNTNKDLLKLYLNFLRDNEQFLKEKYSIVENFEYEYSKYKVAFTPEEIKDNFQLEKASEKDEFFNILKKINSQEDFDELIKNCNNTYLGVFNQGIEFTNKELFWFRNRELVVYALFKLKENDGKSEAMKLMKFCIKKILEKKLFENPIILNNYHCLTLLLSLIVLPLPENDCIDNLNMIESIIRQDMNENIIINKNKILNSNNSIKILNYNQAYDTYNNIINIEKIKNFLKKIFLSNVIKEAFQVLYPSYIKYPFQTEKDIENYINKHLNFVPFYSSKSNGITDKFTSDSYIFLKPKNLSVDGVSSDKLSELLEKILYISGIIKTNFHELNHNFYNMFYYHENGNIPLKTPRNEGLAIREGGRAMELLLFGKIIHNLNIKQALYILNENNYNKNVYQFKEDFEKLCQPSEKINDCRIAGEFSEYNLIDNNEVFGKENLTNVYIKLEDSDNFIIEYSEYDESLEGNVFH